MFFKFITFIIPFRDSFFLFFLDFFSFPWSVFSFSSCSHFYQFKIPSFIFHSFLCFFNSFIFFFWLSFLKTFHWFPPHFLLDHYFFLLHIQIYIISKFLLFYLLQLLNIFLSLSLIPCTFFFTFFVLFILYLTSSSSLSTTYCLSIFYCRDK